MKETYRMQRLLPPVGNTPGKVKPHHVFGGGMLGLSQAAWDALDPIFEIAYMGAAEYEFGELPLALQILAGKEAVAFEFPIEEGGIAVPLEVDLTWQRKRNVVLREARKTKTTAPRAQKPVSKAQSLWILCPKELQSEVIARVESYLRKEPNVKNGAQFLSSLWGYQDVQGWLELDNGFFVFRDKVMWEKTCALFDVPHVTSMHGIDPESATLAGQVGGSP